MTTDSQATAAEPTATDTMFYLADYQAPAYAIDTVALTFELDPTTTIITNRMQMRQLRDAPLVLDGVGLELLSLRLNDEIITADAIDDNSLTISKLPINNFQEQFELEVVTQINPEANKSLEGLYLSNGRFCTQCEAAGFRHITYYLDRPDVMAVFSTTIKAPTTYPILLSNGNAVERGLERGSDGDMHWVRWDDPFKKPCYLFALVAGDLAVLKDTFTTMSGREIALEIYVEPQDADKTEHAMQSLKASMRWDEERFGREYDLDIYMIVAVNDFNMGAMENKGLNVFNAKYVLASADTATDDDYDGIESVIAHEYFHNWTGNRITCRDWFQLSLKEGLTVYRDQEFSADMNSRALERIGSVKRLREFQFPEDAGPTAHPIRPESYGSVNNMYTATVYEKGAEIIRMQATLLGREGFRRGMDLYFDRHDGEAVTCEDFTQCMQDANDVDWTQFLRWYGQAGTPVVRVTDTYNAETGAYSLKLQQHTPDTPGQSNKPPLLIPMAMAIYDATGQRLLEPQVLQLTEREQVFAFTLPKSVVEDMAENIQVKPVPSLLRGFSAPVKLQFDYTVQQLLVLLQHDDDALVVWDAAQRLMTQAVMALVNNLANDGEAQPAEFDHTALIAALEPLLQESCEHDSALIAELLAMPSMNSLAEGFNPIPVDDLHSARLQWQQQLSRALYPAWQALYQRLQNVDSPSARRLKNVALDYLCAGGNTVGLELAAQQQEQAKNMTEEFGALKPQVWNQHAGRQQALERFADKWIQQPLVMDKWLMLQATAPIDNVLEDIQRLIDHPAFDASNPNRIRSLIGAYARMNDVNFHQADGAGYREVANWVIKLDPVNPQVASALVAAFNRWRRYDAERQALMQAELTRIKQNVTSSNVLDIVNRALD